MIYLLPFYVANFPLLSFIILLIFKLIIQFIVLIILLFCSNFMILWYVILPLIIVSSGYLLCNLPRLHPLMKQSNDLL